MSEENQNSHDKPVENQNTQDSKTIQAKKKRKKLLAIVAIIVVLLFVLYLIVHYLFFAHYEETDNAYVQSDIVQVTSQVNGTVLSVDVRDTDFVKESQVIVLLDQTDAKMVLEQAQADLAQTVRQVRSLYTNNRSLQANIALSEASLAKAKVDVAKAQGDLKRRQGLGDALSQEELIHAQVQLSSAKSAESSALAAVNAAKEQLKSNQSLTDGVDVQNHPNVLNAKAKLKEAYITLQRMSIPAPVDGYVARRSVQVGQRISAGTPLMSVIPLNQVWVDANFKEVQLRDMRIGQKATLVADVYGKKVVYHGTLEGVSAGTGSAFSLLPAQNATGNWIKVVQRVPVRISLDPKELKEHPLQVGLSMTVTVDIKDKSGKMLSDQVNKTSATKTQAFNLNKLESESEALANDIIQTNLGKPIAEKNTEAAEAKTMSQIVSEKGQ
ncbi:HlyD family efflux transporter periplasmic adaptor subunit [Neisseria sp. Ec49-e6-T10]|uniref:HlyD family secretion protein n=1 Tax=Neisseria sp. Ec49-e6-T10 TaxID=3140744 RepID=UPI003EB8C40B